MSHSVRARTALLGVVLVLLAAVPAAAAPVGAITRFPGTSGCFITGTLSGACTDAAGVTGSEALAISPDGKSVYVYDFGLGALGIFARDPLTGSVSQLAGTAGCVSEDGTAGTCTNARGPREHTDARNVVVTPDGKYVYVAGEAAPFMISAFSRNTSTGALTELALANGCVSSNGTDGDGASTCQTYAPLDKPNSVAVSPDGKSLYVGLEQNTKGIVTFSIGSDGSLTPVQCLLNTASGGCGGATGLSSAGTPVVSPDGKNVYVASYNGAAIVAFSRDGTTGALTQLSGQQGCVSADGTGGSCVDGRGLSRMYVLTMSADGKNLYGANEATNVAGTGGSVTAFARDATSGALTQLSGTAGCISANGASEDGADTCTAGRAIGDHYDITISPDGRTVYTASYASVGGAGAQGIGVFARGADGGLTQLAGTDGCVSRDGTSDDGADTCTNAGTPVNGPTGVVVSPDGLNTYLAADGSGALVLFSRTLPTSASCSAASVNVAHDTATSVPLTCTDADGDTLTREIVAGPAHGTLGAIDQSAGTVTYTPAAGYSGPDSFTFRATERDGATSAATATLTVAAGQSNPPPPPPDTTAPKGSIATFKARLRDLAKTGKVVVRVKSDEAGSVVADLLVARKDAKKGHLAAARTVRIGRGSKAIAKAGSVKVTIKLTKKAKRNIGKLRKLKVTVRATLKDAAGNKRTVRRSRTLKH